MWRKAHGLQRRMPSSRSSSRSTAPVGIGSLFLKKQVLYIHDLSSYIYIHRCSLFNLGISCCYQLSLNLNSLDSWCWSMSCFSNLFAFFYVLFLWSVWDHSLLGVFWDILFRRKTREKENIYMLSLMNLLQQCYQSKRFSPSSPPLLSVYNLLAFY